MLGADCTAFAQRSRDKIKPAISYMRSVFALMKRCNEAFYWFPRDGADGAITSILKITPQQPLYHLSQILLLDSIGISVRGGWGNKVAERRFFFISRRLKRLHNTLQNTQHS